jgi:hypothetical protein
MTVQLPANLLSAVDSYASANGLTRDAATLKLIETGLAKGRRAKRKPPSEEEIAKFYEQFPGFKELGELPDEFFEAVLSTSKKLRRQKAMLLG